MPLGPFGLGCGFRKLRAEAGGAPRGGGVFVRSLLGEVPLGQGTDVPKGTAVVLGQVPGETQ